MAQASPSLIELESISLTQHFKVGPVLDMSPQTQFPINKQKVGRCWQFTKLAITITRKKTPFSFSYSGFFCLIKLLFTYLLVVVPVHFYQLFSCLLPTVSLFISGLNLASLMFFGSLTHIYRPLMHGPLPPPSIYAHSSPLIHSFTVWFFLQAKGLEYYLLTENDVLFFGLGSFPPCFLLWHSRTVSLLSFLFFQNFFL